ncbi:preprotein translocase subunit SecA [Facilibium subflavum]|uniref:preprotein translocase subunit SecA n=1 Tax=Facilibium subflavum TaxID=2219058 RepID=UPI0038B31ED7
MIIKKIFGSRNDRLIKKMQKTVEKINALEADVEKLTDDALKAKTQEFKIRLQKGQSLDQLLPEAFAVVREAAKRVKGMRHYDVQLIGGMVLHHGKIAEMRTGEGKTLVATLPAYLNALTGKGVHVITVNDYLASRDAQMMGKIYEYLGLSTGVIVSNLSPDARKAAYACDITYGTNNEFGFDYLRDNMAFSKEEQVQRSRNYVIIDEVDSILIDEARTPLIISGASEDSSEMYLLFNRLVPQLIRQEDEEAKDGDFYVDEKSKQAYLTDQGHHKIEEMLVKEGALQPGDNLYSPQHITKMHYLSACLRAHSLYQLNVDYIIRDQEIVIIDENTGRAMEGRRWSDGLHQAIEAKESVKIQGENQTLASITFQNFFKLYDKMSGMTGTADTEAFEFHDIYDLEVVVIPTNRPPQRKDHHDRIFGEQKDKFKALVEDIKARVAKGQPILVGTASIETSEILSTLLRKQKIKHDVLNAKQHEREAAIIAQAGYPGKVTIATNMAGRGTDIILGGNWEAEIEDLEEPTQAQIEQIKTDWRARNKTVIEAGGLCILGSERHDSRRVDNQLRGRAGRQGDPGESRFYLSMDDNLLRIFASDALASRMKKALSGGESIQFGMMTRFIAKAQSKVEQYHFDIRKNLLEYDNVANEQRMVIYNQREELLSKEDVSPLIAHMRVDVAEKLFYDYIPEGSMEEQWDIDGLQNALLGDFAILLDLKKMLKEDVQLTDSHLKEIVIDAIVNEYKDKVKDLDTASVHQFEKITLMQALDSHWREHLNAMDHLRNSINLRGYAQKDPKNEYKKESFELFSSMLDNFKYEVIANLAKIRIQAPEEAQKMEEKWKNAVKNIEAQHEGVLADSGSDSSEQSAAEHNHQPFVREAPKVRRNDPCPCGSGKKYKQCHGKLS